MIIETPDIKVLRSSNLNNEKPFQIAATAKAFQILSKGLYTNPQLAIVREISANCYDSHVAAGKANIPFDVHLPNVLEPFLKFRDYGIGLSPEEVSEIYTTYFASTKTQSNNMIGAFGLGSKTPFSYTDSFSVISFYNGKKYYYTALINESGFPAVNLMHEESTNEPNGLEVKIGIKDRNFSDFAQHAKSVYKWFKVRPNITGANIEFDDSKPIVENEDFCLYKQGNAATVLMGQISYPLDTYQLSSDIRYSPILSYYSLVLKLDIGDVEVTAGRDNLEYNDKTKNVLTTKFKKVVSEVRKLIQSEIEKQSGWWEACIFAKSNINILNSLSGLNWQSHPLTDNINLRNDNISLCKLNMNYGNKIREYSVSEFPIQNNIQFIVEDLPRGGMQRTRQYIRNKGANSTIYYITPEIELEIKKKLVSWPKNLFTNTSVLDKIKRTPRKDTPKIFTLDTAGYRLKDSWVEDKVVDISKGTGIYVELDGVHAKDFNTPNLKDIKSRLQNLSGNNFVLYGIRTKEISKVGSKWIKFENYLTEYINKNNKDFEISVSLDNYLKYREIVKASGLLKDPGVNSIVNDVKYCISNEKRLRSCWQFLLDTGKLKDYKAVDISNSVENCKKKYPLAFFILDRYHSDYPMKEIEDYVKMIDDKKI